MATLELDGADAALELSPARRQRSLQLRNGARPTVFKLQSTAPRRLRVRPALGLLAAGDAVTIQVALSAQQELAAATCKLLVVCRTLAPGSDADAGKLKALWAAAEAQTDPSTLVLSETVNVQIRVDETNSVASAAPTQSVTTPELAEIVLLLMRSQSRKQENALTAAERDKLVAAQTLHRDDWPCWEEYAARMRKLLRERNKRKSQAS